MYRSDLRSPGGTEEAMTLPRKIVVPQVKRVKVQWAVVYWIVWVLAVIGVCVL